MLLTGMPLPSATSVMVRRSSTMPTVQRLLPPLTNSLRKGECGRIAVVGGSSVYSGAPYFSAMTALKVGCDMVHVFCPPEAARVVKTYSPELMVHPSYDHDTIVESEHRIDAYVLGPGIGRDERTGTVVECVVEVAQRNNVPLVIDADGLYLLAKRLDQVKGCANVILTPNYGEFVNLYKAAFKIENIDEESVKSGEAVQQLAKHMGCTVLQKGYSDVITNGIQTHQESSDGSPRRCGGQGDLLNGALAVFAYWAFSKGDAAPMLAAGVAASQLIRRAARIAFEKHGRSTLASDMITEIPEIIALNE